LRRPIEFAEVTAGSYETHDRADSNSWVPTRQIPAHWDLYDPHGVVLAIRFARSNGYHCLRTFHHPRNANAIGMNRRLGFVDEALPTSPTRT
jgi:hypothetical protein